jgi:hypothetical protein
MALGATLPAPAAFAAAFDPVVPNIQGRPAVLLETNYYAYGPGVGFDTPEVTLTLDNRGYSQPATLYLYWQNRVTGATLYYNLRQGFVGQETDLFGTGDGPAKVFVPSLNELELFGPEGALGPLPGNIPTATGQYQFVFEVRDADGVQAVARGNAMYNQVDGVQVVGGEITSNQTWTSNQLWVLGTPVNVLEPAVLTLEPGTVVIGDRGGQGTLIIRPGARILADGNAMQPILFTSQEEVGDRAPGDWGGLVISGNAPTNQGTNPRPEGEGSSGPYGGDDPNDSSGILRYVRVEFAGIRFNEENELNGIALQGVGDGTTVEHVQVHFNQDDGIEFFGGTVNVKWVLVTGAEDDSFDWTFGWNGKAQFVAAIQLGQEADKGIEADNFDVDPNASPRSNPSISHCTFIRRPEVPQQGDTGWQLRRGTAATIKNCYVTGFNDAEHGPVYVDGADSNALVGGLLKVERNLFFGNLGPAPLPGLGPNQVLAASALADPLALVPDLSPQPGSPAASGAMSLADPFFMNAGYRGAVNPANPWIWEGWTTFSDN